MTEVNATVNGATNGRRWAGPVPCQRGAPELIGLSAPGKVQESVEDLEAAALLRAFGAGNAVLSESQPTVDAARDDMIDKWRVARTAIDAVTRRRLAGSVAEAVAAHARVAHRHAEDGPEERTDRTMWKYMVWITLAVAALFDASFIGNVMQRVMGVGPDSWQYQFAYLPGLGIALCLLASGNLLAVHLFRRRDRLSRRRTLGPLNPAVALKRVFWHWRPAEVTREESDLPWSRLFVPVLFVVLTLGMLAALAYVRAYSGKGFATLAGFQVVFVALLLLLSIAAIAVKVQAHNPYADHAKRVKRERGKAERGTEKVIGEARRQVAEHAQSWQQLQSTISAAESTARETVEAACADILETRGRQGVRGPIQLPLVQLRWPDRPETTDEEGETQLPGLNLQLLQGARNVANEFKPGTLTELLETEIAALQGQLQPAHRTR
ncbi:hypothetical protein NLX85_18240 [Micromonospora sp. A3M-1-15]|uniref:hypothetical protein n=1 Tax=Micromonospora sp. A3M-1-15 TaxID=2962035 RepID=UPI0020B8B2D4|nr:hypothetical protein [Micromonospora sp. A3M-1-15]MCP3785303.1 hypothetical protein [Micromonospora sp. A3M-1-15]